MAGQTLASYLAQGSDIGFDSRLIQIPWHMDAWQAGQFVGYISLGPFHIADADIVAVIAMWYLEVSIANANNALRNPHAFGKAC